MSEQTIAGSNPKVKSDARGRRCDTRAVTRWLAFTLSVVLAVQLGAVPASAATTADICLDPGHGGSDPGAVRQWTDPATGVTTTLHEKELNLHIAQRLRAMLEKPVTDGGPGYTVKLTRENNDTALGNSERGVICNSVSAKVVLSIHLNASTSDTADYFRVFYGKMRKDEAFARTIKEHYAISDPVDPTKTLAHASLTNFANGTLLKSTAPAALAEGLFMSHFKEKELLAQGYPSGARANAVADELYKGLLAWLTRT